MSVNRMYFTEEAIQNGEHLKFLTALMELCYSPNTEYLNDIHIIPEDCGAFTVEWIQVPWDRSFGGRFSYVEDDYEIVKAYDLPDKTFEYFHDDNEYEEFLKDWLKNNPGWSKHPIMNTWVKDEEKEVK